MKKKILIAVLLILLIPVIIYFFFPGVLLKYSIRSSLNAAGLEEKVITVDNHRIPYYEGGSGEYVLLVHGFSADKSNWLRFSKYLTPKYHVIIIDLPGFGESTKIETGSYNIKSQAERLDKIASALKMDRFHIAGNSMGGSIAGKYTVQFPGKIISLGLFDTSGVYPCPRKSEMMKLVEQGKNPLLINTPEEFEVMMNFIFVKPPFIPRAVKQYLTDKAIRDRAFNEKIFGQLMEEQYSLKAELPKIKVKTLILWGDKDRLIDLSCTELLEKGLAKYKTVVMKDCGHVPMVERAEETAKHYLDFIQSL